LAEFTDCQGVGGGLKGGLHLTGTVRVERGWGVGEMGETADMQRVGRL